MWTRCWILGLCVSLGLVDGMEMVVSGRLKGGGFGGCGIGGKKVDQGTRMVAGAGVSRGRYTVRVPGECMCGICAADHCLSTRYYCQTCGYPRARGSAGMGGGDRSTGIGGQGSQRIGSGVGEKGEREVRPTS